MWARVVRVKRAREVQVRVVRVVRAQVAASTPARRFPPRFYSYAARGVKAVESGARGAGSGARPGVEARGGPDHDLHTRRSARAMQRAEHRKLSMRRVRRHGSEAGGVRVRATRRGAGRRRT